MADPLRLWQTHCVPIQRGEDRSGALWVYASWRGRKSRQARTFAGRREAGRGQAEKASKKGNRPQIERQTVGSRLVAVKAPAPSAFGPRPDDD